MVNVKNQPHRREEEEESTSKKEQGEKSSSSRRSSERNQDNDNEKSRSSSGQKSQKGSGREEHENRVSPIEVEKYLKGISYPADKQTLLDTASENGASDDVMDLLDEFEDKEYGSPIDVSKEVGRIE